MGWEERPRASAVVQRYGEMPIGRGEDGAGGEGEEQGGWFVAVATNSFRVGRSSLRMSDASARFA